MVAVFGWWNRKREQPLTASPVRPRVKTYSAETGCVYQYVFAGQRPYAEGVEYVFDVSYDRTTHHRMSVFLADHVVAGADLSASMRYGVAKMALRNAFDQRPVSAIHERIAPAAEEVASIIAELGI